PKRKLRVGIIGVGGIAQAHMQGYAKLKDKVDLVAFCDTIPERAEKGAKEYGSRNAKVFTDYREMLEMKDLDAVDICTPNKFHAPQAIDALKAGKHVFCEKPMALNTEEAEAMVKTAKETGLKLSVGYPSRFSDDSQLLKSIIESGELGEIYYAEAAAIRRRGVPTWGVFLSKELQGGGPLIDIGTHIVDLTLWLMGDYSMPVSVLGAAYKKLAPLGGYNIWGPWDPAKFEVEDSAFGLVRLESGATLMVKSSWALNLSEPQPSILCGTKGGAVFGAGQLKIFTQSHDRLVDISPVPTHSSDSLIDREIANWVDALLNDKEPLVKAEEAAQVTRILDLIYKSSDLGKAINLS
ncbi:MAG: Gfo/Idh/MocA family protein, partial [bacterium]